jgi:SAM-dependent methyltransferase
MIYTVNYCGIEPQEERAFQEKYKAQLKEEWYGETYLPRGCEYSAPLHHAPLRPDDVVLDIGCACSYFIIYIADMVKKVYGIDNISSLPWSQNWLDTIWEFEAVKSGEVTVVVEEAAILPFRDGMFDKVFTFSVFEHFHWERGDDVSCAREVYRILKPGGIFTGTVDYNPLDEYPPSHPGAKVYTYDSFVQKIVNAAPFELDGDVKLDPMPNDAPFVSSLFFKLVKQ